MQNLSDYDIQSDMKIDGRKITKDAREHTRKIAIQRVHSGECPEEVIASLGMSRSTIFDWLAKYRSGGWNALKDNKGKGGGRPKKLSGSQIEAVYKAVTSGDPRQQCFDFALWTRELVAQLIQKKFGIKLSKWSVGRLLSQLGLSPQKPLKKAYQKSPELVEKWLKKQYPQIKAQAKKHGATIYFADEASVRSDHQSGTTWGKVGETPTVVSNGSRYSVNMISAVSATGRMKFMIIESRFNTEVFIDFMKRLIKDHEGPVFLIVDGHSAHKSMKTQNFVKASEGKIRLYHLPPYSPELNPDELLWNDLKSNIIGRKVADSKQNLVQMVRTGLMRLQKLKGRIASYFQAKLTSYASLPVR